MNVDHAIEVRALTKRYKNGVLANDAISLDVAAGAVFGLLGRNGAGKSTLIRQISGQLKPTSGSVRVHGIDVIRDPLRAKRLMGVVPQEVEPLDYLTPRQHLLTFGRLHGLGGSVLRRRAEEVLADLGLLEHADKIRSELSGGLNRKVMVAIALVSDPAVLILDEPTTGLDPRSRRDVWALIRRLKARGTTTLITTHYMDEAEALCDRIAIVERGQVRAQGSLDELLSTYGVNFKATYLDTSGQERAIFGETQQDVVSAVGRLNVAEFSISRVSLEDVFLQLTSEEVEADPA